MTVKKLTGIILAIVMMATLLSGCGNSKETKSGESGATQKAPFIIGVNLDTTGGGAALGVPERDTIKMLAEELNKAGGINGYPIKLIESDNESDPTKARLAARRLIDQEKVLAIIGTSQSTTSIPIGEVAEREEVPSIGMGSTDSITQGRKWAFKIPHSNYLYFQELLKDAEKVGVKKIAFLSVDNAYGESGLASYNEEIPKTSLKTVYTAKFPADTTDLSVEFLKAQQSGADGVFVWAVMPGVGIANRDFARLGLQDKGMKLFGGSTLGDPIFLEAAGKEAAKVGTRFLNYKLMQAELLPDSDPVKPIAMNYIGLYENKYKLGARVSYGANAHDAFNTLITAIKDSSVTPDGDLKQNRSALRDSLEKVNYLGILGQINLSAENQHRGSDAQGMVISNIVIGADGKPTYKIAE